MFCWVQGSTSHSPGRGSRDVISVEGHCIYEKSTSESGGVYIYLGSRISIFGEPQTDDKLRWDYPQALENKPGLRKLCPRPRILGGKHKTKSHSVMLTSSDKRRPSQCCSHTRVIFEVTYRLLEIGVFNSGGRSAAEMQIFELSF